MKRLLALAVAAVTALASTNAAQAAFILELRSGASVGYIYDNNVYPGIPFPLVAIGTDSNGTLGNLNVPTPFNFAGYTVSASLAATYTVGPPVEIQQSILSVTNNAGIAPLVVTALNTGNTSPTGPTNIETRLTFLHGTGLIAGNGVTTDTGIDNNFYAPVTLSGFGAASNTANAPAPANYTFSNRITFNLAQGANVDIQSRSILSAVPEPSTLLMAGLGVPALGLIRRWKRMSVAQPATA
jgi:hypothetical protein